MIAINYVLQKACKTNQSRKLITEHVENRTINMLRKIRKILRGIKNIHKIWRKWKRRRNSKLV